MDADEIDLWSLLLAFSVLVGLILALLGFINAAQWMLHAEEPEGLHFVFHDSIIQATGPNSFIFIGDYHARTNQAIDGPIYFEVQIMSLLPGARLTLGLAEDPDSDIQTAVLDPILGRLYHEGALTANSEAFAESDIIGCEITNTSPPMITFSKNGVELPPITIRSRSMFPIIQASSGTHILYNFGDESFIYCPYQDELPRFDSDSPPRYKTTYSVNPRYASILVN